MTYSRLIRALPPLALAAVIGACTVEPVVYAPPPVAVVRVAMAPPPLPFYEQPPCPEQGHLWAPGFWAHGPGGFYWVPGTWVQPPRVGYLWTPAYWAYAGNGFVFHEGYWGMRVGFYGGINYGGGYGGSGYAGGRWVSNAFHYNTAVSNVNVTSVRNVYHETVINNVVVRNTTIASYSGGPGGVRAEPSRAELESERLAHVAPTSAQQQHRSDAATNPALLASHNQGRPPIAATPRPSAFAAPQATAAHPHEPNAARETRPGAAAQPAHATQVESPPPQPAAHDRPAEQAAHGAAAAPAAAAHARAARASEDAPLARPPPPVGAKPATSEETRHTGGAAGRPQPKDSEAEKEAARERGRE